MCGSTVVFICLHQLNSPHINRFQNVDVDVYVDEDVDEVVDVDRILPRRSVHLPRVISAELPLHH
jgi:hypothetical protein